MKVKFKEKEKTPIWFSTKFNTHGLSEVIIQNEDLGADSVFIRDLEIFLEAKKEWKDMAQSFRDRDLISDNYNTTFFEPKTKEDRDRGYTL